ncbi:hypothetical protein CC80DRAFT_91088 [Byssothecium circinans]|uniref:Uncharacterized protein n=1 Tax=Byssothecium circinans TaxID=147558 RepID=A0A6A5TX34_9PLEO|nr:hypothetical protein CC80DRAFT_91088 [Byssothecium circinans]
MQRGEWCLERRDGLVPFFSVLLGFSAPMAKDELKASCSSAARQRVNILRWLDTPLPCWFSVCLRLPLRLPLRLCYFRPAIFLHSLFPFFFFFPLSLSTRCWIVRAQSG